MTAEGKRRRAQRERALMLCETEDGIAGMLTRVFIAAMDAARPLGDVPDSEVERIAESFRAARAGLDVRRMSAAVRRMQGVAEVRNRG